MFKFLWTVSTAILRTEIIVMDPREFTVHISVIQVPGKATAGHTSQWWRDHEFSWETEAASAPDRDYTFVFFSCPFRSSECTATLQQHVSVILLWSDPDLIHLFSWKTSPKKKTLLVWAAQALQNKRFSHSAWRGCCLLLLPLPAPHDFRLVIGQPLTATSSDHSATFEGKKKKKAHGSRKSARLKKESRRKS